MFTEIFSQTRPSEIVQSLMDNWSGYYNSNRFGKADAQENEEGFIITMDMPGIDKEKIDIKLHKDVLTVKAERFAEKNKTNSRYALNERQFGKFERSFLISTPIDETSIKASLTDGVLSISLKKLKEERSRRISID